MKTANEAVEYETIFQTQIFDDIANNYVQYKNVYQAAAQRNDTLAKILTIQAQQSCKFSSPLLSFQIFQEHLSEEKESFKLLTTYMKAISNLPALQYISSFVQFYRMISSIFSFRLSLEDIGSLYVPQAIEKLRTIEDEAIIEQAQHLWQQFKHNWGEAREIVLQLVGCRQQQEERAFESEIVSVSEDSPLIGALLSLNDGGSDAIIKFLESLGKIQDDVLREVDSFREEENLGMIFEELNGQVDLSALPFDRESRCALLSGWEKEDFQHFVLSHVHFKTPLRMRSELVFDKKRIERQVSASYTSMIDSLY